jgi:IS5 family transposase
LLSLCWASRGTDRGYGEPAVERDLHDLGVPTVAIPRKAKTTAARKGIEHSRGFHRVVKWRTGCEGRISYLKRRYGWDRTRLDGRYRAAIWCGRGVLAHNLVKDQRPGQLTSQPGSHRRVTRPYDEDSFRSK